MIPNFHGIDLDAFDLIRHVVPDLPTGMDEYITCVTLEHEAALVLNDWLLEQGREPNGGDLRREYKAHLCMMEHLRTGSCMFPVFEDWYLQLLGGLGLALVSDEHLAADPSQWIQTGIKNERFQCRVCIPAAHSQTTAMDVKA